MQGAFDFAYSLARRVGSCTVLILRNQPTAERLGRKLNAIQALPNGFLDRFREPQLRCRKCVVFRFFAFCTVHEECACRVHVIAEENELPKLECAFGTARGCPEVSVSVAIRATFAAIPTILL